MTIDRVGATLSGPIAYWRRPPPAELGAVRIVRRCVQLIDQPRAGKHTAVNLEVGITWHTLIAPEYLAGLPDICLSQSLIIPGFRIKRVRRDIGMWGN